MVVVMAKTMKFVTLDHGNFTSEILVVIIVQLKEHAIINVQNTSLVIFSHSGRRVSCNQESEKELETRGTFSMCLW